MKKGVKILIAVLLVLLAGYLLLNSGDEESKGIFKDDGKERGEPKICTQDALKCPDGSFVERDPYNNCIFLDCPGS